MTTLLIQTRNEIQTTTNIGVDDCDGGGDDDDPNGD